MRHPLFNIRDTTGLSLLLFLIFVGLFPSFHSRAVAVQPIFSVGAKYAQGVVAGYTPTAGDGLTLNLTGGAAYCGTPPVLVSYAGGSLTMAGNRTNYVYMDPAASCVPTASTTRFVTGLIPLATVVTGARAIAIITDARDWFMPQPARTDSAGGAIASVKKLNNVRFAADFPGVDLGAKINAADADLGSSAGEIWVTSGGAIRTAVVVCANGNNHILRILPGVNLTMSGSLLTPLALALGSVGCQIIGSGPTSVITTQYSGYTGASRNGDAITIGSKVPNFGATSITTISEDIAPGSTSLSVTSSSGFAAGQDILIKENAPGPYRWSEYNFVSAVLDHTHIALKYPTEHKYRLNVDGLGATTGVYGFSAGTITKNWTIADLRITSTTTNPSASGSNDGIAIYVGATDGEIRNVWVDNMGSRGILVGASGYPAGRVMVTGSHIHNCGLVPGAGGAPSLEAYSQSSHVTFRQNQVWNSNSVGISMEAFFGVVDANQVWFTTNGGLGSCFSFSGPEAVTVTGNLAVECSGYGFWFQGDAVEDRFSGKYLMIAGNIAQDTALDAFSFGSRNSSGYVRAQVMGNFAYRARGTNGGFAFWMRVPNTAIDAIGNWAEGNTNAGFFFGNTATGGILSLNTSKNNLVGYSLNSPSNLTFTGNQSDDDVTGIAFGTPANSIFAENKILNAGTNVTGTVGSGSYATSNIGFGNFGATGAGNVGPNQNYAAATLSPAAVPANTCAEQTFTVGLTLATTDAIFVIKPSAQAGLGVAGARVSSANKIGINFCNNTGSPITPTGGESYIIGVLR